MPSATELLTHGTNAVARAMQRQADDEKKKQQERHYFRREGKKLVHDLGKGASWSLGLRSKGVEVKYERSF